MAIKACFNCASIEHLEWIGKSTGESGLILFGSHLTGIYRCTRCGYNGLPLEFDKKKNYVKYNKQRKNEWKPIVGKPSYASKVIYEYAKIILIIMAVMIGIGILAQIIRFIYG